VPLVLLDPASHRRRIAPRLQTLRTGAPSLPPSLLGACGERARDPPRAREAEARRRGGGGGSGERKGSPLLLLLGCFAARAVNRGRKKKNFSLVGEVEEVR
jgi:hypothetical protein